jgi:hypothetical protein
MNFMSGDIQILHNHTILHARSAYEDWPEVELQTAPLAPVAFPAGRSAAATGFCRMLWRGGNRRSRRYHLQGNAAACTANAELSGVVRNR